MKNVFYFMLLSCFFVFISNCKNKEKPAAEEEQFDPITKVVPEIIFNQEANAPLQIELPENYSILREASGDLDEDGKEETVVIVNSDRKGEYGIEREVLIFNTENGVRTLKHRSTGAVLPAQHGGNSIETFQELSIENGAIVFHHSGGSGQKWSTVHQFALQNNSWSLIAMEVENVTPCEVRENFLYDLMSGKVNYKKVYETCDEKGKSKVIKTETANFDNIPEYLPEMTGFVASDVYVNNYKNDQCIPSTSCFDYDSSFTRDEESIKQKLLELVGVYTLTGVNKSLVLMIQPKGEQVEAAYYVLKGKLTQVADFQSEIKNNSPRIFNTFEVNFYKNTFNSDMGRGRIQNTTVGRVITFTNPDSPVNEALKLTYNPQLDFLLTIK